MKLFKTLLLSLLIGFVFIPLFLSAADEPGSSAAELSSNLLDFHLPLDSQLLLAGYKKISFSLKRRVYLNRPELSKETDFLVKQELKLRARGIMARKFYLDIDYDDTRPDESQDIIALYYRGDRDEYLQEAALGDLKLSLARSEFVVYNKSVFGAKFHLVYDGEKSFLGDEKNNLPVYKLPKRDNFTSSPAADPRFTLSNTPLLANPPPRVYPNLDLTVIASRTRGVSARREFRGRSVEREKIIHDTEYEVRKYYKIYQDAAELPIRIGSEKVYLDDRDGYNNDNTKQLADWPGYDFDQLNPGGDYVIDYQTGVLTLRRPPGKDMVLAVEYDGGAGKQSRLLKREDSYSDFELRNRFFLGAYNIEPSQFFLRITDRKLTDQDLSDFPHDIDFEAGILTFRAENPFDLPEYPRAEDWSFQLVLRFEETIRIYLLNPGILRGSEIITLDNEKLERDKDYLIDYESGVITFLKQVEISSDSEIVATYEYLPFGGKFRKNLIGAQVGFNWSDNQRISFTCMQEKSDPLKETPPLGGAPDETRVIDVVAEVGHAGEMLNVNIQGEWARSAYQPNIMDRVFLDSFEDGLTSIELTMNKKDWRISSPPLSILPGESRQSYYLTNSGEDHADDEEIGSLEINYRLQSLNYWIAVNSLIDREGVDISEKSYVEMWVYGDGSGARLEVDLGQINEDADSDNNLDSEDSNLDGRLNPGEDDGFLFNESGSFTETIGADNGRLDSEDLDGDGRLDVLNENYLELGTNITWVGWKRVVLYLADALEQPAASPVPVDRQKIKAARLTLKGSGQGRILIESLRIVGHRWEIGRLDNPATLNLDGTISDRFLVDEGGANSGDFFGEDNEHSLRLLYDLAAGGTGYTRLNYSGAKDLSGYRELNFDILSERPALMFLRLLTTENDYYQWQGDVNYSDFREISLSLKDTNNDGVPDGFTRVGKADLGNVGAVAVGVINNTGGVINGEVYIDNLHLFGSNMKQADAHKVAFQLSWPGYWSLSGKKLRREVNFQTIGKAAVKQTEDEYRLDGKLSVFKFSPVYGWWRHEVFAPRPDPYNAIAGRLRKGRFFDEKRLGGQIILESQPGLLNWRTSLRRNYRFNYGAEHTEKSCLLNSSLLFLRERMERAELKTQYRFLESVDEYETHSVYEFDRRIIERERAIELELRPTRRLRINPGYRLLNSTETRFQTKKLKDRTRAFINTGYTSSFGIDPRARWQEDFLVNYLRNDKREANLKNVYGGGVRLTISKWLDMNSCYLDFDYRHDERGRFLHISKNTYQELRGFMARERLAKDKNLSGLEIKKLVNYRQLNTYQANNQWDVFDWLKMISYYGITKERNRDEGGVSLVTKNSAKTTFNWDLKKMSQLKLSGLNIIPTYQVINTITREEKRNLDINQKVEGVFKWSDNFHTTTSYEQNFKAETSLGDAGEQEAFIRRAPAQSLFYRWRDALIVRVPFTKRRIRLTNRLELKGRYRRAEVRTKNMKDADESNRDDYNLSLKYYFTNLITLTLGGDWINFANLTRS